MDIQLFHHLCCKSYFVSSELLFLGYLSFTNTTLDYFSFINNKLIMSNINPSTLIFFFCSFSSFVSPCKFYNQFV